MSIINTEDAVKQQIYSRDLREFVVPVRTLKNLPVPELNFPDVEHYEDLLRLLFNRCMVQMGMSGMCGFCGIRADCYKYRSVLKEKT